MNKVRLEGRGIATGLAILIVVELIRRYAGFVVEPKYYLGVVAFLLIVVLALSHGQVGEKWAEVASALGLIITSGFFAYELGADTKSIGAVIAIVSFAVLITLLYWNRTPRVMYWLKKVGALIGIVAGSIFIYYVLVLGKLNVNGQAVFLLTVFGISLIPRKNKLTETIGCFLGLGALLLIVQFAILNWESIVMVWNNIF